MDSISRNAGGISTACTGLFNNLAQIGHEVIVFSREDEHSQTDKANWCVSDVRLFAGFGPNSFGAQRGLLSDLKSWDFDILHSHGLWMYTSVAAMLANSRARVRVVSPHGMLDEWALKNAQLKKMLAYQMFERKNLQTCTFIHALNEAEEKSIRALGLQNSIHCVPNGAPAPKYVDCRAPWAEMARPRRKIVLFLGRLHKKKGTIELLQAMSLLRNSDQHDEWDLVFAGWADDDHEQFLKNETQRLGINDRVHFIGPVFGSKKASAFINSDVFILPSHSEGLPMAVLEAWSYAKPTLLSEFCNLGIGFQHNAALKITPSPESIADALVRLSHDERFTSGTMGANAKKLFLNQFSWVEISKRMETLYLEYLHKAVISDREDTA